MADESLEHASHTPEAEARRAEVGKLMADPAWGKDPALTAKRDALYTESGQVPIGEGIEVGKAESAPAVPAAEAEAGSPADAAFRDQVATVVRDRGVDLAATQRGGEWLFGGAEGAKALDVIEDRWLTGLAPEAEVRAHVRMAQLLAGLDRLPRQGASTSEEHAAFPAQLESAMRAKYGSNYDAWIRTRDDTLLHLFYGKPSELGTLAARVDALPPPARLQAYMLIDDGLAELVRLRQYVRI